LDEASDLINGTGHTYGHIVVDEAQDLSPMQLRMLARRSPRGSMTVLGDIAQATGTRAYGSWDEVVPYLPASSSLRREELTVGYRAPGQVLDLASRLLPFSAPGIAPTTSVRRGRHEPSVTAVSPSDLVTAAVAKARELANGEHLVGLIVPEGEIAAAIVAATRSDPDVGLLERDGIALPVTIVPAEGAKGLEFDSVVVVEPAAIADDGVRGLRLLYVALTRPIQQLAVVHVRPLPAALE
jgi:DNA helicase IV